MSTGEYFELIVIPVLIGLTMITLILLFLYTVYGKEGRSGPPHTRFSNVLGGAISLNQLIAFCCGI